MLKIKLKMRGITTQLNLSPFGLTFQLLTATYVNLSTMSNTVAFSRGILLFDKKTTRVGGKLKLLYEFTDPTNMTDILVYYYGHNPFLGFEWNNPIPNSKFRAKHTNPDEWGIGVRGIHILNKNFSK